MPLNNKKPLTPVQIERAAEIFSTLSEPSRLRLLQYLMPGPKTVSELVSESGMKQANVSKHLGILRASRLVEREREGNHVRYAVGDELVFRLCDLVCGNLREQARQEARSLSGR